MRNYEPRLAVITETVVFYWKQSPNSETADSVLRPQSVRSRRDHGQIVDGRADVSKTTTFLPNRCLIASNCNTL
jgi:hypothetical protein